MAHDIGGIIRCMTPRLADTVDEAVRRLYLQSPVNRILKRMGVHDTLRRFYESVYFALPGATTCTLEYQDASAQFIVETLSELTITKSIIKTERPVFDDLVSNLRSDDVFFDVGAHLGVYTCLVGDVLEDGHVVAFEPHHANAARLEQNVELNGLDSTIHQYALSDASGTSAFAVTDGTVVDEPGNQDHALADDGMEVEVTTGDELVERGEAPSPNVVKIDVEGAELDVLRGFEDVLARDECRLVYCEVHLEGGGPHSVQEFGGLPAEVQEQLADHGFDVEVIYEREHGYFLRARSER